MENYKHETKYNIGDVIYVIDEKTSRQPFNKVFKGYSISKQIINSIIIDSDNDVSYRLCDGYPLENEIPQENIFSIDDIDGLNNRLNELLKNEGE